MILKRGKKVTDCEVKSSNFHFNPGSALKLYRLLIISLVFFSCFSLKLFPSGLAYEETAPNNQDSALPREKKLKSDSATVIPRVPEIVLIERYSDKNEFNYEGTPPARESLMSKLIGRVFDFIFKILNTREGTFLLKVLVYLTIAAIIFLLINQLLDGQLTGFFRDSRRDKTFSPILTEEELDNIDFEQLYAEAMRAGDFTAATRYSFLWVLKRFVAKDLIRYSIEKTNYDYLLEVEPLPIASDFKQLTYLYEYSEYGDFEITHDKIEVVNKLLLNLKKATE